jgi:hypothetical protein
LDNNVAIHLRDGDEAVTAQAAALEGAILLSVISGAARAREVPGLELLSR